MLASDPALLVALALALFLLAVVGLYFLLDALPWDWAQAGAEGISVGIARGLEVLFGVGVLSALAAWFWSLCR